MRNDDYNESGVPLSELLRDHISNDPWARRENNDSVGAVITFRPGINVAEADRILTELHRRGIINHTRANEYDSSMGGPVWYIP